GTAEPFFPNTLNLIDPTSGAVTFVNNIIDSSGNGIDGLVDVAADANNNLIGLQTGQAGTNPYRLVTIDTAIAQVTSSNLVTGLPGSGFSSLREGDIAFDTANNVIYAVFSGESGN